MFRILKIMACKNIFHSSGKLISTSKRSDWPAWTSTLKPPTRWKLLKDFSISLTNCSKEKKSKNNWQSSSLLTKTLSKLKLKDICQASYKIRFEQIKKKMTFSAIWALTFMKCGWKDSKYKANKEKMWKDKSKVASNPSSNTLTNTHPLPTIQISFCRPYLSNWPMML